MHPRSKESMIELRPRQGKCGVEIIQVSNDETE